MAMHGNHAIVLCAKFQMIRHLKQMFCSSDISLHFDYMIDFVQIPLICKQIWHVSHVMVIYLRNE